MVRPAECRDPGSSACRKLVLEVPEEKVVAVEQFEMRAQGFGGNSSPSFRPIVWWDLRHPKHDQQAHGYLGP